MEVEAEGFEPGEGFKPDREESGEPGGSVAAASSVAEPGSPDATQRLLKAHPECKRVRKAPEYESGSSVRGKLASDSIEKGPSGSGPRS